MKRAKTTIVGLLKTRGAGGVGRIIELALTEAERTRFDKSVDAVKTLVAAMGQLVKCQHELFISRL